jgi:hypothetical protein
LEWERSQARGRKRRKRMGHQTYTESGTDWMGPNGQTDRDRQARADRPENSDQRDLVVLGGQSAMSVCFVWLVCLCSIG